MATADELRAEQYQRDQAEIAAKRAALAGMLHGSETARRQVEKDWDPIAQMLSERGQCEPVEDC